MDPVYVDSGPRVGSVLGSLFSACRGVLHNSPRFPAPPHHLVLQYPSHTSHNSHTPTSHTGRVHRTLHTILKHYPQLSTPPPLLLSSSTWNIKQVKQLAHTELTRHTQYPHIARFTQLSLITHCSYASFANSHASRALSYKSPARGFVDLTNTQRPFHITHS
jgi:hypothetical protein